MQAGDPIPFGELLQVAGGALGVHRLRAGLLSEDIGADGFPGLFGAELAEKGQGMAPGVYGPGVAVLRGVQVHAPAAGVTQISGDGDGAGGKVDVLPPQGAAFAPPDARVNQEMNEGLPFQRLPLQGGYDFLDLCRGVGQRPVVLDFILPGLWALHLVHGVAVYHVPQVGHLEEAVQDGVNLDDGGVGLAVGLDAQEQGADLRRGDFRELEVAQGGIDFLVEVALIIGSAVLAHGDGFGGHEDPLTILPEGEYLCSLRRFLGGLLPPLRPADDLPGVTLALELRRHRRQLPLDGLAAPAVRDIPAMGETGLPPPPADVDFIIDPPVFGEQLPGRCHGVIPPLGTARYASPFLD